MTFFFFFVSILALVFLIVNLFLAPHNPYQEKDSIFECGFHSFLGQNRTQFGVKFFAFGFIFIILDLELVLFFPFASSEYENDLYGLLVALLFIFMITIGFVFELGKNALKIDSRQVITSLNVKSSNVTELIGKFLVDKKGINNINSLKYSEHTRKLNKNRFFGIFSKNSSSNDLAQIFSFTDISKLYFINKDFFYKFSFIILCVLATLLGISLFMIIFKFREVDLSLYFNI
jgi:NADH-ubiquinone oxidoreductase chain 3